MDFDPQNPALNTHLLVGSQNSTDSFDYNFLDGI
jgi:hypothetical protein